VDRSSLNHEALTTDQHFLREAIRLAAQGAEQNFGGPFGAVVVRRKSIIGRGCNRVIVDNDPTAHAEIMAIRAACRQLGDIQLTGCTLYCSCEPCPMCLGAIYWARPARIVYACRRHDAATIGFDDDFIYREIPLPPAERSIPARELLREEGLALLEWWNAKPDKPVY